MISCASLRTSPSLQVWVLVAFMFGSCGSQPDKPISRESTAMDTFLTITIYDRSIPSERAHALIDSAFSEVRRIETFATDYNDSSEIGRINILAGIDTVSVSEELAGLISTSLSFGNESGGRFDIAIGPIVREWDFLAEHPVVPSRSEIEAFLPLVDHRLVSLVGTRVFLPKKGMRLDLGGIAKGYAVDKAIALLRRAGLRRFIVDLGGNLGVAWDDTRTINGSDVEIMVRHPRDSGRFFGGFKVGSGGVATSGDYQRYFVKDGVRYHHIIDPSTGYPANEVVSVTILADDATNADALSTLVFVLGRKKGMEFIEQTPGIEGVIVYEEGDRLRYEVSPGLKQRFIPAHD